MIRFSRNISILILVMVIVCGPASGASGQCIDFNEQMRTVGGIEIPSETFDLNGNLLYAYLEYGNDEFQIIDISNPEAPLVVSSNDFGWLGDLVYTDGFVYVNDGEHGLTVIDVQDSYAPVVRGTADTPVPGDGWYITVDGDRAYVVAGDGEIFIFSIADPDAPALLGWTTLPDTIRDFAVTQGRAYICGGDNGLFVVDVENPSEISVIWSVPGSYKAKYVTQSNGTVFVATSRLSDGTYWFWVLDPDERDTPTIVSALEIRKTSGIDAQSDIVYLGTHQGLLAIDVSQPQAPEFQGAHGQFNWGISVSGQMACVAREDGGLDIVDLGNSTGPFMLGVAEVYAQNGGHLVIQGDYGLATSNAYGLKIFDLSDPAACEILGSYKSSNSAYGVAVRGEIAFVAEVYSLTSLSYQGVGDPVVLDSVDTPGYARGVAVEGNYVFVADGAPTLSVYETSSAGILSFTSSLTLPTYGEMIVLEDGRAYVHGIDAIEIIDISDPTTPVLLGTAPAGPYAVAFDVVGSHLLVPYNSDVVIYDVSDPSTVTEIARMAAAGTYMEGVSVSNNIAYVCAWDERVSAYDIADISNPLFITDMYNDGNQITGVWAHGDRVYISGLDLTILQSYCAPVRNSHHVPSEYPTIQAAVNAAGPGDEVVIACGTFFEHDIMVPRSMTIRGETGNTGCVVIDAEGLGSGFVVTSGGPVWLKGMTITDGNGYFPENRGGGVHISSSECHLENCTIVNSVSQLGGAMSWESSEGSITACDITGNTSPGSAVHFRYSDVSIQNSLFLANVGTENGNGGAIRVWGGSLVDIQGCEFRNNEAIQGAGVNGAGGSLLIDECVFVQNTGGSGEALYFSGPGHVTLSNSIIAGNEPFPEPVVTPYEAVHIVAYITDTPETQFNVSGNTFYNNNCEGSGQAIWIGTFNGAQMSGSVRNNIVSHTIGRGMYINGLSSLIMECNDLYGNTVGDWVDTVAEWEGINNNISADPLFCDPANGDYQLNYSSPCLPPNSLGGCKIGALGGGCGLVTPPEEVTVEYAPGGVTVAWSTSSKAAPVGVDAIAFYRIYRSSLLGFTPGPETMVHEATSSPWIDGGGELGDFYMVSAVDANGSESVAVGPQNAAGTETPIAHVGALYQNTPNPFNPSTLISYVLPNAGHTHLGIYDIRGRRVATLLNEHHGAGPGQVRWEGKDSFGALVGSGVYFYRLNSVEFEQVKRMVLLK